LLTKVGPANQRSHPGAARVASASRRLGKTAARAKLIPRFIKRGTNIAVVTTTSLKGGCRAHQTQRADRAERVMAVETGPARTPPSADPTLNIQAGRPAGRSLQAARPDPDRDGGDNLARPSARSRDYWLFLIDVAGGRRHSAASVGGRAAVELLIINKTDLRPMCVSISTACARRAGARASRSCSPTAPPARASTGRRPALADVLFDR